MRLPLGIKNLVVRFLRKEEPTKPMVDVKKKAKPIELVIGEEDGYLGSLAACLENSDSKEETGTLELSFTISNPRFIPFMKDGSRAVRPNSPIDGTTDQFSLRIHLKHTKDGTFCPERNNNMINVVEFGVDAAHGGRFRIWEIAVISQEGEFFLTSQVVYEAELLLQGERIVCPFFTDEKWHHWPELVRFLTEVGTKRGLIGQLCPVTEYRREQKPSGRGLKPGTARVLWFAESIRMGAVVTVAGQVARGHVSQLLVPRGKWGRKYLEAGEIVRYKEVMEANQETSKRGTEFPFDVVGVSLI